MTLAMSTQNKSCCSPAREGGQQAPSDQVDLTQNPPVDLRENSVQIPGGSSLIGTDRPVFAVDEEGPLRKTKLKPFRIGRTSVTNAEFARFVAATNYVTEAERFGWSFVFHLQLPEDFQPTLGVAGLEWWRRVEGAYWRDVLGPGSAEAHLHPDHPVVHMSYNDALAYATWAGGRLPSEAEWEHAARGGLGNVRYPWGDDEPNDTDFTPCNIWQGEFPRHNTCLDGYLATAPAQGFQPNGYGLYNMCGNVWEWISDPFKLKSLKREAKMRMQAQKGWRLSKGGSFLCHASYCHRYRIAARMSNSPDSSTTHTGFRVVWDY